MPNYDFKGDVAKATWFQSKYDTWLVELKKRKDVLGMEPDKIKWLYQNDAIFKQFVDIARELEGYLDKVLNALQ